MTATTPLPRRLGVGRVVATHGAASAFDRSGDHFGTILSRHFHGDWGTVCPEDWKLNDHAVDHGERVLSAYDLSDGTTVWVITEWDRSVTTVLLPEEY